MKSNARGELFKGKGLRLAASVFDTFVHRIQIHCDIFSKSNQRKNRTERKVYYACIEEYKVPRHNILKWNGNQISTECMVIKRKPRNWNQCKIFYKNELKFKYSISSLPHWEYQLKSITVQIGRQVNSQTGQTLRDNDEYWRQFGCN